MMVSTLTTVVWFLSFLSHPYAQEQHEYDVIIMGAGSSGIAAAKALFEANVTNILIIEAQWFVGGRTVVHQFADYMLNIGASWISGACTSSSINCSYYNEVNPMFTAANKYNFSYVISDYYHGVILDVGGNQHNQTNSDNTADKFHNALECVWNIMDNITRFHGEDISYFAALRLCGWSQPHDAIDKTIQWLNFEFDWSQHIKWVTATDHLHGIESHELYGPENLFITDSRGYQGIIKALANEFLDIDNIDNEDKIILNSPITQIQYNNDGVTVILENATEYSSKYGIVTFSLGVLQSDIVEFIPQLPSWKMDALLGFDFIDYIVVLVKWPYDFWSEKVGNDSEFIILNDDRFGFFPWVYNLDHPNLYNGSLIWRFDLALDIAQMVALENINDTIIQIVDLKLKHYFDNVPNPDDIFVGTWRSNKYVQGSYSNWPPGFTYDSKEAMRWPLLQRLFFAGESMHDDYGYVHTAWANGDYTANQILSCMGMDNDEQFKCPSEYVPPSSDIDCKTLDESVFKELVWLWIILGVVFGIILGYLVAKYCRNRDYNKGMAVVDNNYGSVVDDVQMTS